MTNRERMLSGKLYDSSDAELLALRRRARRLCRMLEDAGEEELPGLFRELLGRTGERLEITPPFRCDYGCNTFFGDHCYVNFNATVLDCARVEVGDDVFLGPNVSLLTPVHPLVYEERRLRPMPDGAFRAMEYALPIRLEDGVWLGGGVTVNGGVTIGRGSVVGSGSVVTRDLPPGVLAAGVPCRVIRPITEADRLGGSLWPPAT